MDIDQNKVKFFALVLAWCVPFLIVIPILIKLTSYFFVWDFTYGLVDYATFVGGIAGPIAALAGFLFIYLSFESQNTQFNKNKIDDMFFRLFDLYKESREKITYKNGGDNGDLAFYKIINQTYLWVSRHWQSGYNTDDLKDKFIKGSGYQWIDKPNDFKIENIDTNTLKRFLDINDNEEYYGLYKRSFMQLIKFCFKHNLDDYLVMIESSMGKHERIYQYYNCSSRIEKDLEEFLLKNRFLESVSKKHLDETCFGVLFWYREKLTQGE